MRTITGFTSQQPQRESPKIRTAHFLSSANSEQLRSWTLPEDSEGAFGVGRKEHGSSYPEPPGLEREGW